MDPNSSQPSNSPAEQPPIETSAELLTYEAEPTTNTEATMPQPSPPPEVPVQREKRWRLVALIVTVAIIVIGGGAATYALWYQNPQKVITDSAAHALQAKSVSYTATMGTTGSNMVTITLDGQAAAGKQSDTVSLNFMTDGKSTTVKGAAVVDPSNNVYVKVTNVTDLVKPYRSQLPASSQKLLDNLVAKINNTWIKLTATDLQNYDTAVAAFQQCSTVAIKSLQSNKAVDTEIANLYKKHQFITVDKRLGSKNGSLGYQLSINHTVVTAFFHDFASTALYKTIHKCDPSFTVNENAVLKGSDAAGTTTHTELWVSRWTHQITSASTTVNDTKAHSTTTLAIKPVFNKAVNVTIPSKSTTVAQLMQDLQAILQSALTSAS